MKIVVTIKQVPNSTQVKISEETGNLIRDNLNNKMNPYDLYAIETALKIKETIGACKVTTISMGPKQALEVLKESIFLGCDDAVLLSDRRFAGADVLATSFCLKEGIKQTGDFDLIITGKQTTDGDTAQVGAEISEMLGLPYVSNVVQINSVNEDELEVVSNLDDYFQTVKVKLPCVLSVEKNIYTPRLPSYKLKRVFNPDKILVRTLDDLNIKDVKYYGINGSPTSVDKIFIPEFDVVKKEYKGNEEILAKSLKNILEELKYL